MDPEKIVIIVAVAALLIGPQHFSTYARQLARITKRVKSWADEAKEAVEAEVGSDIEWS
jgi:sec-independent protein translocase protein TatB